MTDAPKLKLVVQKPMRIGMSDSPIGGPDNVPCLEISKDESMPNRLIKQMYEYQMKYYDKPAAFLLTVEEYLSFWATIRETICGSPSMTDSIMFQDIPVRCGSGGIEINLKNLTQIAWENTRAKEQEKK